MTSYLPHVGFVQFPQSPADLTSAVCPACFTPRAGGACARCGLDLSNPAVAELDGLSAQAATVLDRRLELIGRIRFESEQSRVAAAAQAAASVTAATAARPATSVPPAESAPAPTAAAPAAAAPLAPRRHLGVQVILLIVGVSLISVGAIFFLIYAFINFGLVWRSVIIGSVTVAAIVTASLLRRRRLTATAEAIAALAVVFVHLDVFALRANDLFDLGAVDGLRYWGVGLVVTAVGLAVWHRLSGLRLPNIIAFAAFGPGTALLVGSVTESLESPARLFAAFLGLAATGLALPLVRHRVFERALLLGLASVGFLGAGIFALLVDISNDLTPVITFGLAVATAAGLTVVSLRAGSRFAVTFAAFAAVAAVVTPAVIAARVGEQELGVSLPILVAIAVALALGLALPRLVGLADTAVTVAHWCAWGIAGVYAIFTVGSAALPTLALAFGGGARWSQPGGLTTTAEPSSVVALVTLFGAAALITAAWRVGAVLGARRAFVLSLIAFGAVLAVPYGHYLWLTVLGWLVLAAAAVTTLIYGRSWSANVRVPIAVVGALAAVLAYAVSWQSIDTWWYGSVGVVLLLVAVRWAVVSPLPRAALLAVASVLALVAVGFEGLHINERFVDGFAAADAVTAVVLLSAILVIVSAQLARTSLSRFEVGVLFGVGYAAALLGAGVRWLLGFAAPSTPDVVFDTHVSGAVLAALLVLGFVLWLLPTSRALPTSPVLAAVTLPAMAAWLLVSLAEATALPDPVVSTAPAIAGVVAAGSALLVGVRSPSTAPTRTNLDAGTGILLAATIATAVYFTTSTTWLVLLLAGVAALLIAIAPDGLFGSQHPRRFVGWAALALGVTALWWRLGDDLVADLEPYVLPVAGALLVIALLLWRARRDSAAPPLVALAALLVGLVPLAVIGSDGPLARPLVVGAVSATLLLVGSFIKATDAQRPYLDAAATAGAVGLLIAGFGRPLQLAADHERDDATLDLWLAVTLAVLLLAGLGQARLAGTGTRLRAIVGQVVVIAALVGAALIEARVLDTGDAGFPRALGLIVLLGGAHVVGMLVERPPFTRTVGWVALGLAVVVGLTGLVVGALEFVEWVVVPLAAARLIVGIVLLRRYPDASSWPWIGPAALVLVVPSLLATFSPSEQPIWRLVGLGVACVALVVWGALGRLQAPLIIGAVVVVVHALRTFSPQLLSVYQAAEWWVWAVIGGAIIIFIAVTFERRMRDLKAVGGRLASLR